MSELAGMASKDSHSFSMLLWLSPAGHWETAMCWGQALSQWEADCSVELNTGEVYDRHASQKAMMPSW